MALPVSGQVGAQNLGDGTNLQPLRQGRQADLIVSELHGRLYEQNYRGNIYGGGMSSLTSIANATFTVSTLGATSTPIAGIWNPAQSTVNAVVLQAVLDVVITALQATGGGPYVWAISQGNVLFPLSSIGVVGTNRKTLSTSGAQCKALSGGALTGLTNNLVVSAASALGGGPIYNASLLGTAAGFMPGYQGSVENIDGSWIVPPGGVLALLATTTPVALSAVSCIVWEEVPL